MMYNILIYFLSQFENPISFPLTEIETKLMNAFNDVSDRASNCANNLDSNLEQFAP